MVLLLPGIGKHAGGPTLVQDLGVHDPLHGSVDELNQAALSGCGSKFDSQMPV